MTYYKTVQQLSAVDAPGGPIAVFVRVSGTHLVSGHYESLKGAWQALLRPSSLSKFLSTSDMSWFKPKKHSGELHF